MDDLNKFEGVWVCFAAWDEYQNPGEDECWDCLGGHWCDTHSQEYEMSEPFRMLVIDMDDIETGEWYDMSEIPAYGFEGCFESYYSSHQSKYDMWAESYNF